MSLPRDRLRNSNTRQMFSSVCYPRKKESGLQQVNEGLLHRLDAEQVQVIVHKVEAAEVDEMWSFVGSKSQQRWLWHAMDHYTGQVLAYVFGTREDEIGRASCRERVWRMGVGCG